MKKKIGIIVTSLVLVATMLLGLCACGSTWGKIKSAYEKEGYKEVQLSDKIKEALNLEDDTDGYNVTLHFMTTAKLSEEPTLLELAGLLTAKNVIIAEYTNTEELKKYANDHFSDAEKEDAVAAWEKFQQLDSVNGNCMLIIGDSKIFKGTK